MFVPKHLVMFILLYRPNTGHRASSLYNESSTQKKFTFKCRRRNIYSVRSSSVWFFAEKGFLSIDSVLSNVEVVTLLTFCSNCQVFAHFALQSSPMKLYFWYLSCKHFPEITHQYILFDPLFLHLKHFEASALLCIVKGILLDIGRNLWHSRVLHRKSVIFPTH